MSEQNSAPQPARLGLGTGIGMVVAIFGFSSIWIGLGGHFLHLHSFFASFLFAWYWGAAERLDFKRWLPSLLGSLAGIAASWQLAYLTAHYGGAGTGIGVAVIALLVLCLVMQWFTSVVNMSAMLFMAVLAAPQFASANYLELAGAAAGGALFIGAVAFAALQIIAFFSKAKPQAAV